MHDGQLFVLAIIGITMFGGIIRTAIHAKHGIPMEERKRWRRRHGQDDQAVDLDSQRKIDLLSNENERLVGQIGRLEERLRVLERIATDPAERVSREIDELRNR